MTELKSEKGPKGRNVRFELSYYHLTWFVPMEKFIEELEEYYHLFLIGAGDSVIRKELFPRPNWGEKKEPGVMRIFLDILPEAFSKGLISALKESTLKSLRSVEDFFELLRKKNKEWCITAKGFAFEEAKITPANVEEQEDEQESFKRDNFKYPSRDDTKGFYKKPYVPNKVNAMMRNQQTQNVESDMDEEAVESNEEEKYTEIDEEEEDVNSEVEEEQLDKQIAAMGSAQFKGRDSNQKVFTPNKILPKPIGPKASAGLPCFKHLLSNGNCPKGNKCLYTHSQEAMEELYKKVISTTKFNGNHKLSVMEASDIENETDDEEVVVDPLINSTRTAILQSISAYLPSNIMVMKGLVIKDQRFIESNHILCDS